MLNIKTEPGKRGGIIFFLRGEAVEVAHAATEIVETALGAGNIPLIAAATWSPQKTRAAYKVVVATR